MSEDRRAFLKTMGGLSAAVASTSALLDTSAVAEEVQDKGAREISPAAIAPSPRSGPPALELNGVLVGLLKSLEGGTPFADVVVEKLGAGGGYPRKNLAQVSYDDILVAAGAALEADFYSWIQDTLNLDYKRRDGAILALDFAFKVHARREFENALITEVTFPKLDGASKDAAYLTVKITPELTRSAKGGGSAKPVNTKQKKWQASNFRLAIADLDTKKVSQIEPIVFKQPVTEDGIGTRRTKEISGPPEVSNLVITLAEAAALPFQDWFEDFVIKGNNGQEAEKTGFLEFLAPDLKTVLFRLDFSGLGIFSLKPVETSASDAIRRVTVEMYCEQLAFSFKGAVA